MITLVLASSGSSIQIASCSSNGMFPRLMESIGGTYIYNLNRVLYRLGSSGSSFDDIASSEMLAVSAMYEVARSGASPYGTVILGTDTTGVPVFKSQLQPETAGGWSSGSSMDTGFSASDAISLYYETVAIVGNSHQGVESRVVRDTSTTASVTPTFSDSDAGIPQYPAYTIANSAKITDLEAAE